jgi:hypothetical protein
MIRHLLSGVTALALMTGAAFAQDGYTTRTTTTVTQNPDVAPAPDGPDRAGNAVAGGMSGAAVGAAIGCLATLPIGCAPGAGVGAAIGGGTGVVIGTAATPPSPYYSQSQQQ